MECKWRFNPSKGGKRKGISDANSETFKKSPYASFAREILQNSLDARKEDDEPVILEFKTFDLKTKEIPDLDSILKSIDSCIEFNKFKEDYVEEYGKRKEILLKDKVRCLRISDFNTTGLVGVDTDNPEKNKFLALNKGDGVSEKSGSLSGGSKGIGKNVMFLMSEVGIVFDATIANQDIYGNFGNYKGSMGIADFISGYVNLDTEEGRKDYTSGTGYYGIDEYNAPLKEVLNFDNNYQRTEEKYGTDIFIIAFKEEEGWEEEVVKSICNSFMYAIYRNNLVVELNGILINRDSLGDIINNIRDSKAKNKLLSEYIVIYSDIPENAVIFDRDIYTELGPVSLYFYQFPKTEKELATNKCSLIRYPYMKIKDFKIGGSLRVSAICIIENDALGKKLLSIENPQHNDWETKRIKNISERKAVEALISKLKDDICNEIIKTLSSGEDDYIDPEGAGEYLPANMSGKSEGEKENKAPVHKSFTISTKLRKNKFVDNNQDQINENREGVAPYLGEVNTEEEGLNVVSDSPFPSGEGGIKDENDPKGENEGFNEVLKKTSFSDIKFKVVSVNKGEGILKVIFIAPEDKEECYLSINALDDNNDIERVKILKMSNNGQEIVSKPDYEYGPFAIKLNEKYSFLVTVEKKGYFGCGVKIYYANTK